MLAIWSAAPDPRFARRLGDAGFAVDEVAVRARSNGKGPRHVIWFATTRLDAKGKARSRVVTDHGSTEQDSIACVSCRSVRDDPCNSIERSAMNKFLTAALAAGAAVATLAAIPAQAREGCGRGYPPWLTMAAACPIAAARVVVARARRAPGDRQLSMTAAAIGMVGAITSTAIATITAGATARSRAIDRRRVREGEPAAVAFGTSAA